MTNIVITKKTRLNPIAPTIILSLFFKVFLITIVDNIALNIKKVPRIMSSPGTLGIYVSLNGILDTSDIKYDTKIPHNKFIIPNRSHTPVDLIIFSKYNDCSYYYYHHKNKGKSRWVINKDVR